jgi:galactonate dehydratase
MADRIADIDCYLVSGDGGTGGWLLRKPYVLVRLRTEDGLTGWGEAHTPNYRETALPPLIRALGERLAGTDPGAIAAVSALAYDGFGEHRTGMDVHAAVAAVEIALWDCLGKRLGVPVWQLLGGANRPGVEVYANIWRRHPPAPADLAEIALEQVAAGYRAIKLYPFLGGETLEAGLARLDAVAAAVEGQARLAIDFWRQCDPASARRLIAALAPYDLLWAEDPLPPDDPAGYADLKARAAMPLMTGETANSRHELRALLEARAADYINPDICATGILEMRRIAAMARPFQVTLCPHNSNSMALGTAAMLHAVAGVERLGMCEYFPGQQAVLDDVCEGRAVPKGGWLTLPEGPGLGLHFDEAALERYRVVL